MEFQTYSSLYGLIIYPVRVLILTRPISKKKVATRTFQHLHFSLVVIYCRHSYFGMKYLCILPLLLAHLQNSQIKTLIYFSTNKSKKMRILAFHLNGHWLISKWFFFQFDKAENKDQLNTVIDSFKTSLRKHINPHNLNRFVKAFMK